MSAIEAKEFAVVVADQSMPEMAGIEFLKKVKQRSPDTVGMIIQLGSDQAIYLNLK